MANISLSEAEKTFILHGVEEDFRCDGRSRRDYRPMELETDLVSNASGSARLRLANTDVLVGIKTEIDKPNYLTPDQGKIEFFVDCSANATPEFEGRGGEELALELADTLTNAYESPKAFDLKFLCILPGQQCWKLFVDILILECGGNLFDAVSLAAKAALFNTRIPRVTAALMDAGEADLMISDDPYDCTRIQIDNLPILVTVCKIGDSCVVDPSAEEEECSIASVVVGVSKRNGKSEEVEILGDFLNVSYAARVQSKMFINKKSLIQTEIAYRRIYDEKHHIGAKKNAKWLLGSYMSNVHTIGEGSLHKDTMHNCVLLGLSAADDLNNELVKALNVEEMRVGSKRRNTIGFLK